MSIPDNWSGALTLLSRLVYCFYGRDKRINGSGCWPIVSLDNWSPCKGYYILWNIYSGRLVNGNIQFKSGALVVQRLLEAFLPLYYQFLQIQLWRFFHVWGSSYVVVAIPGALPVAEFGKWQKACLNDCREQCISLNPFLAVYISMITVISVNISNVTLSLATLFNQLQVSLYVMTLSISLLVAYLICHRIFSCTEKI